MAPWKPPTPCPVCHRVGCNDRAHRRGKGSAYNTAREKRRRAQVVAQYSAQHGDVCPGWLRGPHPADDLTAADVRPSAVSGLEAQELRVLCRSCNQDKP